MGHVTEKLVPFMALLYILLICRYHPLIASRHCTICIQALFSKVLSTQQL
ncbi:MAG: hypothetical protein ACLU6Y_13980 [Ruminococcus sp.]